MTQIDNELVKQLAGILNDTGLTEIEYDTGGLRIRVARNVQQTVVAAAPAVAGAAVAHAAPTAAPPIATPADAASHPGALKSPMVGVVYLSPEPGLPPFVKVGEAVTEGQTILLIEAMKTFNPVKASRSGKLVSVLVDTGSPVEYGEPLAIIE